MKIQFASQVSIMGTPIGTGFPPYVVAELSANHDGDLGKALAMIEAAAECGVNAIKLQTYTADTITLNSDRPEFQITRGPRKGMSLYQLYQKGSTPWEWHESLFRKANDLGIAAFSSPFDFTAIDFLESLGAPAYKIASFELVDLPLIRKAAGTGKPIIMSTGIANLEAIRDAVRTCREAGNDQAIVLHCVSGYPTPISETNLRTIEALKKETGALVGLSDHTLTLESSLGAVALGACFIEKHFTLSRKDEGLDAAFSLEPEEFRSLVMRVRTVWEALGVPSFDLKPSESYTARLQRSLYVVKDMEPGERFAPENVRSVRPNNGLAPKHYDKVMSGRARFRIKKYTPLSWDLVEL